MLKKPIPSFLVHSVVATIGSMACGILLGFLVALPFALFSSGLGNIVDRAADTWIARYAVEEPYFAIPVLIAAFFGFESHRFSSSRSGALSWLVPAAVLLVNIFSKVTNSAQGGKWVFDNFFSAGCGASECLYEVFVTAPFYTSVAYTVGWLCNAKMKSMRSPDPASASVRHG